MRKHKSKLAADESGVKNIDPNGDATSNPSAWTRRTEAGVVLKGGSKQTNPQSEARSPEQDETKVENSSEGAKDTEPNDMKKSPPQRNLNDRLKPNEPAGRGTDASKGK